MQEGCFDERNPTGERILQDAWWRLTNLRPTGEGAARAERIRLAKAACARAEAAGDRMSHDEAEACYRRAVELAPDVPRLPVVPALGKVVIPRVWQTYSDRLPEESEHQRWCEIPWANIGLVLGPQSGTSRCWTSTPTIPN
jgi:mannosyltransferase OCH1-like enzyme